MKKITNYFTKFELFLWLFSMAVITLSSIVFDKQNYLNLICSLLGATALIFCAKGNPIGSAIMIVFSVIYAIISYSFRYYGEMLTYVGMTAPTAAIAAIEWIRHPFEQGKSQVAVAKLTPLKIIGLGVLTAIVTAVFYFILKYG